MTNHDFSCHEGQAFDIAIRENRRIEGLTPISDTHFRALMDGKKGRAYDPRRYHEIDLHIEPAFPETRL